MSDILFNSKTGETWLSNFHLSDIEYEGKVYPSVEHFYQAMKLLPDYPEEAEKIRVARTPSTAKALGNSHPGLAADWDERRLEVMRMALKLKFAPGTELAQKLLDTGDDKLIEFAPWGDRFWGVDADYVGKNWLGVMLMELRAELKIRGCQISHFVRRTTKNENMALVLPVLLDLQGQHYLGTTDVLIPENIFEVLIEGETIRQLDNPIVVDPEKTLQIGPDGYVWYVSSRDLYGNPEQFSVARDPEMSTKTRYWAPEKLSLHPY